MGIHRSAIRRRDREDAAATKIVNRKRKLAERDRRRDRMVDTVKAGQLPYSPAVMSWLSRGIGKPASKLTQEEVNQFVS